VMWRHERGDGRHHVGAAERRGEVTRIEASHLRRRAGEAGVGDGT
jgi:hypothetical protein